MHISNCFKVFCYKVKLTRVVKRGNGKEKNFLMG